MIQQDLLSWTTGDRDGASYVAARDRLRLDTQAGRIFKLMQDGKWRTLEQICREAGIRKEQSASARLRDFRKARFGAHTVDDRHVEGGLYEYRLLVNRQGVAA